MAERERRRWGRRCQSLSAALTLVVVVIVVAAEVALAEELEENKGRKEFGWKGARKGGGKERQETALATSARGTEIKQRRASEPLPVPQASRRRRKNNRRKKKTKSSSSSSSKKNKKTKKRKRPTKLDEYDYEYDDDYDRDDGYSAPQAPVVSSSSYDSPASSYNAPASSYEAPAPSYAAPSYEKPSYNAPSDSYGGGGGGGGGGGSDKFRDYLNALAAFLPIGLFLAAIPPNIVTINTGRKKRSLEYHWPFLEEIGQMGYSRLASDNECQKLILCQMAVFGGESENANAVQKFLHGAATGIAPKLVLGLAGMADWTEAASTKNCNNKIKCT